jgi:hypothetical protein
VKRKKMNKNKNVIGLTLVTIMIASIFAVLPIPVAGGAPPSTPVADDNPVITQPLNQTPYGSSLRVYGEDDKGPAGTDYDDQGQFVYPEYWDPFDPTALQKDSLTFNPGIVQDGQYGEMYATESTDIHVKAFLRLWYEPLHQYTKDIYVRPTVEVETTYMLVDAQDCIPTKGKAGGTAFVFPIAEVPLQTGLGRYENDLQAGSTYGGVRNLTDLVYVGGTVGNYSKTTNGTIQLEKDYTLVMGDEVQFLDHNLKYNYIVSKADGYYAKVTVSYTGNIAPDSARTVDLGVFDDGTAQGATKRTWFDRHNNRYSTVSHPEHRTWYAEYHGYVPGTYAATISVGKEISAGDTFYVNAVRYDVPAVEVLDTDDDTTADAFKYITLRTPLPKLSTSILVPDDGKASSQWIDTIIPEERIPLLPPFNVYTDGYWMVDDINVVLWKPAANQDEWPVGNPASTLGVQYFPWAERYLTMQEDAIMAEEQFGLPVGANWFTYFGGADNMKINTNALEPGDHGWIAYDACERIVENMQTPLLFCYVEETTEPRYSTILLEKLHEEFPGDEQPVENWTWLDINTKPDQYTAFALPNRSNIVTPNWTKTGDYLLTTSFLAPNSINLSDLNRTGIPRMSFAYDVEKERDVTGTPSTMGDGLDIYVNKNDNVTSSVRIYGEDDIGSIDGYGERGISTYKDYQSPFHPAAIRKDSITFNPAIVEWNGTEYPMSAYNQWRTPRPDVDVDTKKFLRIWYEPEHKYSKNTAWEDLENYTYPTIEVESTYMMIDSQDKLPTTGQAGKTYFAFAIAEDESTTDVHGLELFENPGSRPTMNNVVTVADVDGTVGTYNKTVYDNATIRIEKTYTLSPQEEVQFLDHKLTFKNLIVTANDTYWALVDIDYAGNIVDGDQVSDEQLGNLSGDPHAITWFGRHGGGEVAPGHPNPKWYARYNGYIVGPDPKDASITVGMELEAGDVFFVDGVRYDVPAIEVIDGDGNGTNGAELFKYITLRTPLPKMDGIRVTTDTVEDSGIPLIDSQWLDTIAPGDIIPLNPPFNMEHYIVDDIDVSQAAYPLVADRIIGAYEPLVIKYLTEAIEPRYSTNLLEILNETNIGRQDLAENWTKYDIITRPDQYTEFLLPGDQERWNFTIEEWETPLHNDYLITTSFLAPNAQNSDLSDFTYPYNRTAFVFDAIDLNGIYVNELVGLPPGPPEAAPDVFCSITPSGDVRSGIPITACVSAEHFKWPLDVVVNWGDGTPVSTGVLADNTSQVCFEHTYLAKGIKNITQYATDIYDNTGVNDTTYVNVTSDGFRLVIRPGWNLFSIPVNDTIDVGDVFDPTNNSWFTGLVYYWKTDQSWGTTSTLDPKHGYFVYGPPSGTYEVVVSGTAETFDNSWWVSGWNLVGPGNAPQTIPEWAYWWNSDTWTYQPTHDLAVGKGYWVAL